LGRAHPAFCHLEATQADTLAKIPLYNRLKTAEINTAIERTQREIELIEEYRTTLLPALHYSLRFPH